ncbi:MAG: HEAT repeat domain-containing protein [Myxococcota bacterium]|nr:HEAT repeat domain-containing protein [Myxococcota bacterium]
MKCLTSLSPFSFAAATFILAAVLVAPPASAGPRSGGKAPSLAKVLKKIQIATECSSLTPDRCRALKEIIDYGDKGIKVVGQAMVKSEGRHRAVAVTALGLMEAKEMGPQILGLFSDRDRGVRVAAIQAVGRLKPAGTPEALARAIGSENLNEKLVAAVALGRTGSPGAVEPLVSALSHFHPKVKMSAARSLGLLKAREATRPLAILLADPVTVAPVRRVLCAALGDIGDPDGVPILLQVLGDPDVRVRKDAISALGRLKDDRAIAALSLLARVDELADVSVVALGTIGHRDALPALIRLLKEKRQPKPVLQRAFWAVGSIRSPSSVSALKAFLKDPDTELVLWATDALGRLQDEHATEALLDVLRRDEPELKEMAAWALQQISGKNLGLDIKRWESWVYAPDRKP